MVGKPLRRNDCASRQFHSAEISSAGGVRLDQFLAGAGGALCAVASGKPFRNLSACWN